jgi:hypothetical protein
VINLERSLSLDTNIGKEFRAWLESKIEELKHAH